ncbi:MAG: YqgE/AlgH family protein [Verrucomicrobia bacterium]|nr:YqgE/AlgH family protein [Verrucomicrobiota bacterium]
MGSQKRFLNGKLLLDGGNLAGSFFHRTVVLICRHDPEGAFGLVLNRPSGVRVGDALSGDLPEQVKRQPLFVGGPVQPSALSALLYDPFAPEGDVLPHVSLTHSLEELVEFYREGAPGRKARIFAGYSGWSPGQLEGEMRRKAWLTHPAKLDLIFRASPKSLWRKVLEAKGPKYRLIALAPENPAWN